MFVFTTQHERSPDGLGQYCVAEHDQEQENLSKSNMVCYMHEVNFTVLVVLSALISNREFVVFIRCFAKPNTTSTAQREFVTQKA